VGAVRHAALDSPVSRRTFLKAVQAILLTPATAAIPLASAGSARDSSLKSRRLRIDQRFLLFPVNGESLSRRVRLVRNGHVLRTFTASLGLPAQWWAHLDVSAWYGRTLTLSIEPDNSPPTWLGKAQGRGACESNAAELVAAIRASAEIWSPETLYKEPLRPAFHFTPKRGWINDPNGLMYYAGQYHLFFQHNPYGLRLENQHWGHAVSTDLVHWKELPIALYPRGGDLPFSGSGVVDHENTSGWRKRGRPAMIIAFTSSGRGECIAYSQDEGGTWKEFKGNPVIKHSGRDPRLLWHPETQQWVMAVYSERPGAHAATPRMGIAFHTSADLKSWEERSWIEGYYECPDLFTLPVDGDANRTKWVLSCAPGYYCIGEFDGSRFIPDGPRLAGPTGGDSNAQGILAPPFPLLYAAQSFSHHPEGHRVQIAWGRVETAGAPFTQLLSFPTTLSLRTTSDGVRLCREPVEAIRSLRTHTYDLPPAPLTESALLTELKGDAWDIEAVIRVGTVSPVLMIIGGDEYIYQPASQMLRGPKGSMQIPLNGGRLSLRILVDRTVVEVFGDSGQAYGMFVRDNPGGSAPLELRTWKLISEPVHVEKLTAHSLRSIWSTA
jgi:fructan beta-fructosidase